MNGFTFYRSYMEAVEELPKEEQALFYRAIVEYMFNGGSPDEELSGAALELDTVSRLLFKAIRRNLDHSIKQGNNSRKSKSNPNEIQTESKLNQVQVQDKDKYKVQGQCQCDIEKTSNYVKAAKESLKR